MAMIPMPRNAERTYERHGFLITPLEPNNAGLRWRGWRGEDGQSFRTDTLNGAFRMARAMQEVGAWD